KRGKKRIFFTLFSFLFSLQAAFAQNGVPLSVEIQHVEKISAKQEASPAERHDAFVRLARLKQLSGDVEGAARNWLEAARAIPGKVDDDALLACAFCLAAMGEWERAEAALSPLLEKMPRAVFLARVIKACKTGDVSALAALADDPAFFPMKSEICFMLWKLTDGAETWKRRLLSECPESAEARVALGDFGSHIIVKASPFWLFINSFSRAETGAPSSALAASLMEKAEADSAKPPRLQTGLFSQKANAQAQAEKLNKAGFSPSIEPRGMNGKEAWAVTVPAGPDINRGIRDLRAAGFESFPLR
ncbi:MAG: hypothetical protein LBU82_05870, partial [Treponema sp.]|nr:hypothetical protein [Treponema sp.]